MKINIRCKRLAAGILALASLSLASSALAQVSIMPDRGAFDGTAIVVWGNTTLPGGTTYEFDFGDGSPVVTGAVNAASQSYIAVSHIFSTALPQQDFTVAFTVGTDTATAVVRVYDPTALTADQLEEQQINNAIQDGLRYQYWSVDSRELRHDSGWPLASWAGSNHAFTSMAVLAFENHGYTLASGDIYSPVVQGGLNFVFQGLAAQTLNVEPAGDPCVGLTPGDCLGYRSNQWPYGYSTSIALLAIAGSQAPGEFVGPYGPGAGKTYLEVAQRIANTVAWGQADSGTYRGGWRYGLDDNWSDGSAIGWNVLGLLDAEAFGVTVPPFVKSELEHILAYTTNSSGSMGYTAASSIPNTAKTGIRLQALAFIGVPVGGTTSVGTVTPQASIDYIDTGWTMGAPNSCNWGAGYHPTGSPNLVQHWNCIYSTFNVFKGLKLYGVTTLPNVVRPDDDWHKEYQMYLVGIQAADGNFGQLLASGFPVQGDTSLALLVLSSTALILPDPVKFATLGLQPVTAENFVDEMHTVTAHAEGACAPEPCTGAPVPGATVDFEVLTGPSAGATGTAITDASGNATFTYDNPTDSIGTDTIQANIGLLYSNVVEKNWVPRDTEPPIASNLVVNPNPAAVTELITITANIDDTTTGNSDIMSAFFTVDGGAPIPMAASDGTFDSPTEDVTATTSFAGAGVHTICVYGYDVIVPDPSNVICVLLAVYDPSAGFVTGGGWIDSPVGAYVPDPMLTGKATFGFVSKYKKGQSVPDGNTVFQFHAADMKFKSTAYDWLVIAGKRAKYKGVGLINGAGNYGFMLSGIDGDLQGGDGIDKFRIKIWDRDAGDAVVYDNEIGSDDAADASTALGGGSIVIHSK